MAKVFAIHTVEFKPGVTEEEYLDEVIASWKSLSAIEGAEYIPLKGFRGERKGKYAALFVRDTMEVYEKYMGTESSSATAELPKEWQDAIGKFFAFATSDSTDYSVI